MLKIPFGRHRGKPVADLPTRYLNWLREQTLLEPLASAVVTELRRRAELNGPLCPAWDKPPPPVVSINREGPVAEVSFFLPEGRRLDDEQQADVGRLLLAATLRADFPDGPTRTVLSAEAGFAIVPAAEADDLAAELRSILGRGVIR